MNSKFTLLILMLSISIVQVLADDDDYHWLRECDGRCDLSNRMNPFVPGCDDCCRGRGPFSKGKCKGFGWKYCMCKMSKGQRLLNALLNG